MGILDIIILLTLILSGAYGCWKGIVIQMGALAGVVMGILSCRIFGQWLTNFLQIHCFSMDAQETEHYICLVVAYVVLFVLGYVITRTLAQLVKTVAKSLNLTVIDRISGSLFSIFQWMLALSIMINILVVVFNYNVLTYATLAGGRIGRAVADLAPVVFGYM